MTRSPYRWVRPPSTTGARLLLAGMGIAQANALSDLVLTVLPAAGCLWRMRVEEAALTEVPPWPKCWATATAALPPAGPGWFPGCPEQVEGRRVAPRTHRSCER
jgi:hypothetical protein